MGKSTVTMLKSNYVSELNQALRPSKNPKYVVLDLFSGCGGLSLGFEAAGFKSIGIDCDKACCDTYNANLKGECLNELITTKMQFPKADVIIGGPPCQPFSVRGKQLGDNDRRNGVPAFIKAVEQIRPSIWIFENVRGVLYRNKSYFKSSMKKLEKLGYKVDVKLMNCVDYSVPQNRERIIAVGHDGKFEYPTPFEYRVTAGEALENLAFEIPSNAKFLTPDMDRYVALYEKASRCKPRDLHLDRPARTLTCRNLAGCTSDMHRIKLHDGRRRRLTIREAARLQSFPDWFEFTGNETSRFNQVGNAVPPLFALSLAKNLKHYIDNS